MKLIVVLSLLLIAMFSHAQAITDKSGTGTLLDIKQTLNKDSGAIVASAGLEYKFYEIKVPDEASGRYLVFEARCQDYLFTKCPVDFVIGDPIKFRIKKHDMMLPLPNGKELKTKIVNMRIYNNKPQ